MWPHWPQLLWCQVLASGIFLVRPNLVVTSTKGSGTFGTIHSPLASSSSTWSRMDSLFTVSGARWNTRDDFLVNVATSIAMTNLLVLYGRVEVEAGFFELLLHDVHEDHVEALVDLLDHVHHPGHVPDQVELAEGLFAHLPARLGGVQRFRWQRPAPPLEIVGDAFDVRPPVGKCAGLQHVGRHLGAGRHDLVDDAAVTFERFLGALQAVLHGHFAHDRDQTAR